MSIDIIPTTLSCNMDNDELALEIKKIEIATAMSALLVFCKKNSTYIADKLNKTPSQISKTLSGDQNLTIKTILEFSLALGYDFDVVFHSETYSKPKQPWQKYQDQLIFEKILTSMKNSSKNVTYDVKRAFFSKNLLDDNISKINQHLNDGSIKIVLSNRRVSDKFVYDI